MFDAALARSFWGRLGKQSYVYLWADSSPIAGRSWLLSQVHTIPISSIRDLAHSVDQLASGRVQVDVGRDSDAEAEEADGSLDCGDVRNAEVHRGHAPRARLQLDVGGGSDSERSCPRDALPRLWPLLQE